LGAAVLVNNGSYHLLLDGQQRLATSTILLAALRDKMKEYRETAATQLQEQYIFFQDHLTGKRIAKIELNLFDRAFFRDFIQSFPRLAETKPQKNSHELIRKAYEYFQNRIAEGWDAAGAGQKGFEWAAHVTNTLREHMVLVTVTSNNERSAADIFSTLNDRGIGLSTVDLIRTYVLQRADDTHREEILQCWDEMFNACGTVIGAETLIRMSWVAQHGDVKARALYKIVSDALPTKISPLDYSRRLRTDGLLYRQFRDGDTDDSELQDHWLALRILNFSAGFVPLLSASQKLTTPEQKNLAKALVALVVRHNIVCNLDRAKLESVSYSAAKKASDGAGFEAVLADLRGSSPGNVQFEQSFARLSFSKAEHGIARYMLRTIESHMAGTEENTVAGSDRVHVEHIYPQSPPMESRWEQHHRWVVQLGNLTLLSRRLNEQIKNADFTTKLEQAYKGSKLEVTKALGKYETWSPRTIERRQAELCEIAQLIWPAGLI
jgi:hypothetical protein